MSYLGMDTARASGLESTLRQAAAMVDEAQGLVVAAEQRGDLVARVDLPLEEIGRTYWLLAAVIRRARLELTRFELPGTLAVQPIGVPADRVSPAWNQVRQDASHNTYQVPGGVAALHAAGVRTFELDIHRGAPTDFTPISSAWPSAGRAVTVVVDHLTHGGGAPDDWRVYHLSGSAESEYLYLRDGLQAVAALPATDPVTIFVDNKDNFGGTHTAELLDTVVRAELGQRLYSPADLQARAPRASSLFEAVTISGWPTVDELQGKVLVVLTDEVASYRPEDPAVFVAQPPEFTNALGRVVHRPDPSSVFYNVNVGDVTSAELEALQATNSVVRTYFNPLCGVAPLVNYRATDITTSSPECM